MRAKHLSRTLQNLTRLLLVLSLVSVALLHHTEYSGAPTLCSPRGVAVATASKCACEDSAGFSLSAEFAKAPARLMPAIEIVSHEPLALRPCPEPGLYANPIDLPRLTRKMAPPGADNAPFPSFLSF